MSDQQSIASRIAEKARLNQRVTDLAGLEIDSPKTKKKSPQEGSLAQIELSRRAQEGSEQERTSSGGNGNSPNRHSLNMKRPQSERNYLE